MVLDLLEISKYRHIDLRSEKEYEKGNIPNSVNIPILENKEFEKIGKEYKVNGQKAAIKLGLSLVSGDTKNRRISDWTKHILSNEGCSIFCFRGGLRSQIAQEWLLENNIQINRIMGGYKSVRKEILEYYDNSKTYKKNWYILGGLTGSGKTILLNKFKQAIDIEGIANHRGSAFGRTNTGQPSSANFENILAFSYLNNFYPAILLEDESKRIGKATLPKRWYNKMQESALIVMDLKIEERIHNIVNEYVIWPLQKPSSSELLRDRYLRALERIQKRLGGVLFKEIYILIEKAFSTNSFPDHEKWVYNLLNFYYDPMYNHKLNLRKEFIVHRGDAESCYDYISSIN